MNKWALIVATLGRVDELDRLLKSLTKVSESQFRVIIIDQNEDERLVSLVTSYEKKLSLEHLRVSQRGVSNARNVGLSLLQDEHYIAFPDDDCVYEADVLEAAETAFESTLQANVLVSNWFPIGTQSPVSNKNTKTRMLSKISALHQSPTYTLFFRREAIDEAGAFDVRLGPGGGTPWLCGEDADYMLRAGGLFGQVAFAPGIRVSHPQVDAAGLADKAHGYGRGRMRVLSKHKYPMWFKIASILHPLVGCLLAKKNTRRFKWYLFKGRLYEWLNPHVVEHQ